MSFYLITQSLRFSERVELLKKEFSVSSDSAQLYEKIIAYGQNQTSFSEEWKLEDSLVKGCQSLMYLKTVYENGKVFFYTYSDALISKGLAVILTSIYSGLLPQDVLLNPPNFLQEMGMIQSLSPGRANGVASLYVKMKQEALSRLAHKDQ